MLPETKKNQPNSKPELNESYAITLHLMGKFEYAWESEYFDLEAIKNDNIEYGSIPFSLETFLELYKDPRIWEVVLRPKSDEL